MNNKLLLILVDGMRPDAVENCGEPDMPEFFRSGTYSLGARTVYPPITLPAHISLFHSVDPDRHRTTDNIYTRQNHPVDSLIGRLAAAKKTSAMFYSWHPLRDICTPDTELTMSYFINGHAQKTTEDLYAMEHRLTAEAIRCIRESRPDFVFLYLGATDEIGHRSGWMSEAQLAELRNAWSCIREIREMLPGEYSLILTADHGGHGRDHGDDVPEDRTIPMTFHGPRFRKNCPVEGLDIKDIAPTVAELVGAEPGDEWEGTSRVNL